MFIIYDRISCVNIYIYLENCLNSFIDLQLTKLYKYKELNVVTIRPKQKNT